MLIHRARNIIYVLSLSILFISCHRIEPRPFQPTEQDTNKIATFCKVWGFLKYYHPKVAKGNIDWDKEFMTRIKAIVVLNSKQDLSDYYIKWIDDLGRVKSCKNCIDIDNIPDSLKRNLDLGWLSDTTLFSDELIQKLQYIEKNRNQGVNYYAKLNQIYVSFINENGYSDSIYPGSEMRLLALSRYWNMINYFYPYKYVIGQHWNNVLEEMIPRFVNAKDTLAYNLAMLELTIRINDSHANFESKYISRYYGSEFVPFAFKLIDSAAIAYKFLNDTLCRLNDIQIGDVFLMVDGVKINQIIRDKSAYVGASNDAGRLRNFYGNIFNGNTDSVKVLYERGGVTKEKYLYRYDPQKSHFITKILSGTDTYKVIDQDIGYVNLGRVQPNQIDTVMKKFAHTNAIIFDIRNYPKDMIDELPYYLGNKRRPYVLFTKSDVSFPGIFRYTERNYCGGYNNEPYTGKIILLINEWTQSQAELLVMALQTSHNVICIGSQTAGADGNVVEVVFPGGYKTYFSGIGVYYPNGKPTQRIGILPDIEVKPTIEGIKSGKDEVMEKAIEVANIE